MDGLATNKAYCDEGDIDGRGNAHAGADFDFTLDPGLRIGGSVTEIVSSPGDAPHRGELTMVAEIPGYPIRKLPFAGPETRTKAAISITQFPHHHGHAEGAH